MRRIKKQMESQIETVDLITLTNPSSAISEQYRTIRTNIQFVPTDRQPIKTLVVTSSGPAEGKSTTAANLAVVFAQAGKEVLLVDTDMRKPVLAKTFQINNSYGLSNTLSFSGNMEDGIQKTTMEYLSILPSGPTPPNPSELLSSSRMDELMKELNQLYEIVIFDMPPVVAVTDAQILSAKADGTLLVVREGISKKESLLKAKGLLEMSQAKVLGVVYNGMQQNKETNYYYSS